MLAIYDNGQKYPITGYSDFFITHVEGGEDTLSFTIPIDEPSYKKIAEESHIEYGDNYYNVKSINSPSNYAKIECVIDLDFLKESFYRSYDSGSKTLAELLSHLLPTGWTVQGGLPTIRRTIKLDNAKPYDILEQAKSTYGVDYEWHTKTQILKIVNPDVNTPTGQYLTDELNLRKIAFKGKSEDLVTRLYAYGKDGLTFADVNGGKEYVDNLQYTDKIIVGVWEDERYTNKDSLLADAKAMVKQLSLPERSYDCDVIDLAKFDSQYSDFAFAMYKIVTLIDRQRNARINHKIVEYREYPDEPQRNVLTLATTIKDITKRLNTVQNDVNNIKNNVNVTQTKQERLSDMMTNALGYFYTEQKDEQERITSYMHNKPLLSDSQIIWKRNIEGFATSTDGGETWNSGVSVDGSAIFKSIEVEGLLANVIKAGLLKSVSGDTEINLDTGVAKLTGSLTTVSDENGFYSITDGSGVRIFRDSELVGWLWGFKHPRDGEISWLKADRIDGVSLDVKNIYGIRPDSKTYLAMQTDSAGIAQRNVRSISILQPSKADSGTFDVGLKDLIVAEATEKGLRFWNDRVWLNEYVKFSEWTNGSAGINSDTHESILRGARGVVKAVGGSTFAAENDRFVMYNSPSNLFENFNNLDMHKWSILNQSDARLKTDIKPTDINGLDLINAIDLQKFRWIENGNYEDIGIIAQQLQEIAPDLVHTNPADGHLSIKTDKLVYYCIKAIQELSGKKESKPLSLELDPRQKWRYTRNMIKKSIPEKIEEAEEQDDTENDNS